MQPSLFDAPIDPVVPRPVDQTARDFAADPANHVVLEASAGTGKTRVLVDRYVRLLQSGVDPRHVLAITFTRKAAAEMRDRVLAELRLRADRGEIPTARWRALSDRVADIQISTIDAFCFGLLREFPLEADVDPAFEIADETEMARFANEALDVTQRIARGLMAGDETIRLLFSRIKSPVLLDGLRTMIDRRQVAGPAIAAFVRAHAGAASAAEAAAAFVDRVRRLLAASASRSAILDDAPVGAPEFDWLRADLERLDAFPDRDVVAVQQFRQRLERHFLTKQGEPRKKLSYKKSAFASDAAFKRHQEAVVALALPMAEALDALTADVNGLLARGFQRLFAIATDQYERLLAEHALLDFAGMLGRAVALLERQEEFARSRLKLQARYHHVLVDEFQDTSRAQWRLISLLIDAWGEGEGVADEPTSIFIVGDRKQSIYRFRHAEATLLEEAARRIAALRPGGVVRQAITHSFRAVPELLAFVNALATSMTSAAALDERFEYGDADRFPAPGVGAGALRDGQPVLGLIAEPTMRACAEAAAVEVQRLLASTLVRDRSAGTRPARADDIAILFRSRAGHQYFEDALESRGIRTYVYKGLGFFDAPEVQDVQALLRYLAQPDSDLRAAELLRSRLVRVSDPGLVALAPRFAEALRSRAFDPAACGLGDLDRALLEQARAGVHRWLALADRVTPSELIDVVLRESAYARELGGRRFDQSRENIKKVRALVRRIENRGYATLGRLADYFETLRAGDESNAVVEASGCVNLMTIHAAKGLEFPIVFVVNLQAPARSRQGVTVIERGPTGAPEVAFDETDGTELEDARDAEELRRLMYVAVTRSRDRLYLAGLVDRRGGLDAPRRSLAGLLPLSLTQLPLSDPEGDRPTWIAAEASFTFQRCRPGDRPAEEPSGSAADFVVDTLGPIGPTGSVVPAAVVAPEPTSTAAPGRPRGAASPGGAGGHERLIGTLVHRLFEARVDPATPVDRIAQDLEARVRPEERVDVADFASVARSAAALFVSFRTRADVAVLFDAGRVEFEVPFSYQPAGQPGLTTRGVVDAVAVGEDGGITVVEFKTGAPRREHEAQAGVYARAFRAVWPGRKLDVKILYP